MSTKKVRISARNAKQSADLAEKKAHLLGLEIDEKMERSTKDDWEQFVDGMNYSKNRVVPRVKRICTNQKTTCSTGTILNEEEDRSRSPDLFTEDEMEDYFRNQMRDLEELPMNHDTKECEAKIIQNIILRANFH